MPSGRHRFGADIGMAVEHGKAVTVFQSAVRLAEEAVFGM
jgi:hypothetical protein